MMPLDQFVTKALCVPFKDKGRDYEGWDCWGLIRVGLHDVYGLEIPSYRDDYTDTGLTRGSLDELTVLCRTYAKEIYRDVWRRTDTPSPGDVVLMNIGGRPIHVGLYIGNNRFIHAERKINTQVERINSVGWSSRIEAFYRHAE